MPRARASLSKLLTLNIQEGSPGQVVLAVVATLYLAIGLFELVAPPVALTVGLSAKDQPGVHTRVLALAVGLATAVPTLVIGRLLFPNSAPAGAPAAGRTEARVGVALAIGITATIGLWPFGLLLGPAALIMGLHAMRRIRASRGGLGGFALAATATCLGAAVTGLYLFLVNMEAIALLLFGDMVPLGV